MVKLVILIHKALTHLLCALLWHGQGNCRHPHYIAHAIYLVLLLSLSVRSWICVEFQSTNYFCTGCIRSKWFSSVQAVCILYTVQLLVKNVYVTKLCRYIRICSGEMPTDGFQKVWCHAQRRWSVTKLLYIYTRNVTRIICHSCFLSCTTALSKCHNSPLLCFFRVVQKMRSKKYK